jgi:hypothetical protein
MNKKPTELAMEYAALKKEHGTVEATAAAAGVSVAKVSRYLRLLQLPAERQAKVDAGELPVNDPFQDRRERPRRKTNLSDEQGRLFEWLGHCLYMTQQQAAGYLKKSYAQSRVHMTTLMSLGLVDVNREFSPFAYTLSSKGFAAAGLGKPKHFMSSNAIHQRLMRNEIELAMRERNPKARFIRRQTAWAMGLYPAVGEHLLQYEREGRPAYALVVIDDYFMASKRLPHMLDKLHDSKKSTVSGDHVLRWRDVVDTVFLYVTDAGHKRNHERFILKNREALGMRIVVRLIEPIWKVV